MKIHKKKLLNIANLVCMSIEGESLDEDDRAKADSLLSVAKAVRDYDVDLYHAGLSLGLSALASAAKEEGFPKDTRKRLLCMADYFASQSKYMGGE